MRGQVLCTIVALFAVVWCETIHFTNSPSHLKGSTNITSYKLLVNNSDPITIIEANKEIEAHPFNRYPENSYQPNDRIDLDIDRDDEVPMRNDFKMKLVANLGASHHLETKNTHNIRDAIGITISGSPSDTNTPVNSYRKSGQDDDSDINGNSNVKKLVYSPILLKKFLNEYTEKLKTADINKKNDLQKIHEKIYEQQHNSDDHLNRDRPEIDKPFGELEQKYGYNNRFHDKFDDDRQKPDRYKDSDGWVTLEAVPWSSSSVSKWYPNGNGNGNEDTRRRPSKNPGRPYNDKPNHFPYHDDYEEDYFNRPKPTYQDRNDRPGVYSTWTKPQSINNNGRPKPQPYVFTESGSFGSHKYFDRNRSPSSGRPRPGSGDLITDDRPSNFPSESHRPNYPDDDHYNTASSNIHSSFQDHQSEGNGQWVLISTTRGYQIPGGNRRQYGKRALTMPSNPSVTANAPVHSVRMHKAVKLTVLPANDNTNDKNSTFSTDKKPAITTTTIHGGMVEIDASHGSIDDDVRATLAKKKKPIDSQKNKRPSTVSNKNRRKLLKGNSGLEEWIE